MEWNDSAESLASDHARAERRQMPICGPSEVLIQVCKSSASGQVRLFLPTWQWRKSFSRRRYDAT
jgi:hypothetical protein